MTLRVLWVCRQELRPTLAQFSLLREDAVSHFVITAFQTPTLRYNQPHSLLAGACCLLPELKLSLTERRLALLAVSIVGALQSNGTTSWKLVKPDAVTLAIGLLV